MPKINTKDIFELPGGYTESFGPEGGTATRAFDCAWGDWEDVIEGFLGTARINNNTLERTLPDQHPRFSGLYCMALDLEEGIGEFDDTGDDDLIKFDKVRFKTHYEMPRFQLVSDDNLDAGADAPELARYVIRERKFTFQNISLPGSVFQFSGGSDIPEGYSLPLAFEEWRYTWVRVPEVPIDNIHDAEGTINSSIFDADGFNAEVGTLLFTGVEQTPYRDPVSMELVYDLTYSFSYKNSGNTGGGSPTYFGWNYFLDGNFSWSLVVGKADSNDRPYSSTDLHELFKHS